MTKIDSVRWESSFENPPVFGFFSLMFFSSSYKNCVRIKVWIWVPYWQNYCGILRYPLKKGFILKMLLKKLEVMFLCTLSLTYTDQRCNMFINPLLLVNYSVFTIGSSKSSPGNFILNIIKGFLLSFNNFVILLTNKIKISNSAGLMDQNICRSSGCRYARCFQSRNPNVNIQ